MDLITRFVIVPLSLAALLTGMLQSLDGMGAVQTLLAVGEEGGLAQAVIRA